MSFFRRDKKTSYRNNRGASLMLAIIIIGVILVFAFSLLLVSYNLYASQNKKAASIRCSEAANSLSVALEDELEDPEAYKHSSLWKYLRCNLLVNEQTWPYYDPGVAGHNEEDAFRYFDMTVNGNYEQDPTTKVEGFPGSLKMCIYWTPSDSTMETINSSTNFTQLTTAQRSDSYVYIKIIAESSSQTYVVTNKYKIKIDDLHIDTSTEDKAVSDEIKKISKIKYGNNGGYIYNPMKLSATTDTGTTDPIKLTEGWTFDLVTRE